MVITKTSIKSPRQPPYPFVGQPLWTTPPPPSKHFGFHAGIQRRNLQILSIGLPRTRPTVRNLWVLEAGRSLPILSQNVWIHPGIRNKGLLKEEQLNNLKMQCLRFMWDHPAKIVGPRHPLSASKLGRKIWDDSNTTQCLRCLSSDTEVPSFTNWILNALEELTVALLYLTYLFFV